MGVWEALAIAVAALATSALSAVAGMGGGLILLTVMVALVEPAVAIPLHGAIQIASNSTRTLTLRQHVVWPLVVRHSLLLVPAGVLGLLAADALPADLGRALIGVFALVAVWFPRLITPNPAKPIAPNGFVAVGALQGFLNIPIGATGPMIAPFFRSALEQRHGFIATFAAAQTIGHVVKVGVFTADGLDLSAYLWVVALSAVAVIVGTKLGARVLDSISEDTFGRIFKLALTVVAARLVIVYVF